MVPITLGEALLPGQFRPYGPLTRADGGETFAVGAAVPGVPWTVLHEIDATAALAPLRQFAMIVLIVAGLVGLALALAFAAFWWQVLGAVPIRTRSPKSAVFLAFVLVPPPSFA